MILHLGFEIPEKESKELNHSVPSLTAQEKKIIKGQIKKNAQKIDEYISRLDLMLNKEQHPQKEVFVQRMRERLALLMAENDTFRKVLWKHFQSEEVKG